MSGGYGVNVQVPGSDGVNVHVSGRIASCFWVIFGPSLPAFGINPRQQVRHTDSSQTQAAGTDMSPVVSSLLLGLVLCWSGTQATKPSELIKVCPRFDPSICPLAKPGPEECKTDSKCLGGKKCCCSNCGLKCVTPEQVKPGRCPPVVVRCMTPLPDPKCHSDFQCPGKKKCCEMCGISCMDPKEEPRGVCPASEEVKAERSLTCASFECTRDSDCWPDEKCCVSGNSKKCLKPFPGTESDGRNLLQNVPFPNSGSPYISFHNSYWPALHYFYFIFILKLHIILYHIMLLLTD
uniref:WAP domain-containing protein n=1 Tax=Leptobrachium leishanense TaxID=445787 RepID=A0A8C5QXC1_9ANUR